MLDPENDELLTRVGPRTPLGEMMRRYWHPIALSSQVEADGAPLRTKLLGERFVVFRDTDGKVGVLEEMCMHRGVSLALGRNEEGGLRCIYHGWKFAVDGTILETPNHADCRFRQARRAPAFPVHEQSGLIWTYIGPKEEQPPFREFVYDRVPEANRAVFRANNRAAFLPMWEGGLDSSHVSILHTDLLRPSWTGARRGDEGVEVGSWDSLSPTYEAEETPFGFHYCAFRDIPGQEGIVRNARLVPAIMPYMRIIPSARGPHTFAFEVPMDDFETATYVVAWSEGGPVDPEPLRLMLGFAGPYFDPVTHDVKIDWGNRLGQDRSKMGDSWTGIQGLEMEDFAMSVSLGEDWSRTKENLVTSDMAIVRMRRMLIDAVRRFQNGEAPPAVKVSDMTGVRAFDLNIGSDEGWQGLADSNRLAEAAQ